MCTQSCGATRFATPGRAVQRNAMRSCTCCVALVARRDPARGSRTRAVCCVAPSCEYAQFHTYLSPATTSSPTLAEVKDGFGDLDESNLKIHQGGVQRTQGVVAYIML